MAPRKKQPQGPAAADEESTSDGTIALPDVMDDDPDPVVARLPAVPAAISTRAGPARDPVRRFMAEARQYERLSEPEERTLIGAVRERGDKNAARKLVLHNLRLVVSIAYQYRQAWTSMLDLFQEGSVGLMEAIKHWDPNLGTRFGSYAAYWIRACILRFLMTNSRLIHVGNTRAGRKLFFRLEKERQKLLAQGFEVTPRLLAAKLDVTEEDLAEVSAHLASREVSIDPQPDDEDSGVADRLSGRAASPEQATARGELSSNVARLMKDFAESLDDERERVIWREHLAAVDEAAPLGVLGERFGVSKQRIGQIAEKLKRRFRDKVVAELGADFQLEWQPEESE